MKSRLRPFYHTAIILISVLSVSSCVPVKKLKYFNDIDELQAPYINPLKEKLISPHDRLFIKVLSIDEQANQVFNSVDEVTVNNTSNIIGYYVNEAGTIDFPFLGEVHLAGLSVPEAMKKMTTELKDYVPGSEVVIKYIDNKVTVLGEVNSQGVYSFSKDKLTVYEALGLGGGLTRYGNRKNIVLIREENGRITHHKINLSDSKIAGKDIYYVLPNDIIVVEPLKSLSVSYQNTTYNSILGTITTIIAILLFAGVSVPGS